MAGGLAALLDDVAAIVKLTSAASTKALGIVVDDTAVTPQYISGVSPARELPIIWKIAKGSLLNKMVILVVALIASQFAPWILPPILLVGGAYLSFEGAEKIMEAVLPGKQDDDEGAAPVLERGADSEKKLVRGAITTDFILSAEIMIISLASVADAPLAMRAVTLAGVAVVITTLVYGVVAILVKMDDIGLAMMKRRSGLSAKVGNLLVQGMPKIMSLLSIVGVAAMLWVGGHILVTSLATIGWRKPHHIIEHIAALVHGFPAAGALAWLVETVCSAMVGLAVGLIIASAFQLAHLVAKKIRSK
ncbi:MAG: DUF808 domain-containing protein [Propionibacteriaceae bacterium]